MAVWAIGDLHLSFGVPNKEMDVFGPQWKDYTSKIESHWRSLITPDDLVLIPGDISWASNIEEARPDLEWIGTLPGTKALIKGNHDYWWSSLAKVKSILPPSCHLIQNNSLTWNAFAIAGTRLWDIPGLSFDGIIDFIPNERCRSSLTEQDHSSDSQKIYQRELGRLEASLKSLSPSAGKRIVMTHYPPIGSDLEETEVSRLLEKYQIDLCVFGHLHNVKTGLKLFGQHHGVTYHLTSCDYLNDFQPLRVFE